MVFEIERAQSYQNKIEQLQGALLVLLSNKEANVSKELPKKYLSIEASRVSQRVCYVHLYIYIYIYSIQTRTNVQAWNI